MTRHSFYRWFLIPMGVMLVLLLILKINFFNIMFFSVAYAWHMALTVPGMKQKVEMPNYRFSVLRIIYQWNEAGEKIFNQQKKPMISALLRICGPLTFLTGILVLANSGNLLYALLGCFVFEILLFVRWVFNKEGRSQPDS